MTAIPSRPKLFLAIALVIVSSVLSTGIFSCTNVFWNNNTFTKVVARSMDLYISDSPQIVVYPRGITRSGDAGENSLSWKSKYGNVVVTAFNTNAVSDGLNEHGLAVHLLYLSGTAYPQRDFQIPALANVLWAQYLLDNYKTVAEALERIEHFQIVATKVNNKEWPIHLTMEDASGDSAIIEYVKGKMQVYHGKQYRIMTNEPAYNIQLSNLKKYKSFGGSLPLPGDTDPLSRFVRVATYLQTLPAPKSNVDAIAGVLSVIRTAMVPFGAVDTSNTKTEDAWPTRWVTVADLQKKIYYFNSTTAPNIIWLDFKNLNFSELSPTLVIDPAKLNLVGEVSAYLSKPKT